MGGWVVDRGSCLFEDKKKKRHISAPSVLGPNLQLPGLRVRFRVRVRVRVRVKSMYT